MKTRALLNLLNEKEKLALLGQLKSEDKPRLQKALSVFIKKEEPTKDELYKAIFNEKYSDTKDVNLRNELRLLNETIKNFVATKAVLDNESEFYKQMILLRRYKSVGDFDLFSKEWNEYMSQLNLPTDLPMRNFMMFLKMETLAQSVYKKNGNWPSVFEFWKGYKTEAVNYALFSYLEYCHLYNQISKLINKSTPKLNKDDVTFKPIQPDDIVFAKDESELFDDIQYLRALTKTADYTVTPEQAIEILLKAEPFVNKNSNEDLVQYYQRISYYYGVERSGDYEQALIFQLKALNAMTPEMMANRKYYLTIVNTVEAYCWAKKYNDCIFFFEKHQSFLCENDPNYTAHLKEVIYCYIAVRDFDKAFDIFPRDFSKLSKYITYIFRLIFCLIQIGLKDYPMAKREANNALKALPKANLEFDDLEIYFKAILQCTEFLSGKRKNKFQVLDLMQSKNYQLILFKREFDSFLKTSI